MGNEETHEEIRKGDLVKVRSDLTQQDKEEGAWASKPPFKERMERTQGKLGRVIGKNGNHLKVDIHNSGQWFYLPEHLKKAKKWQIKKYNKRKLLQSAI